MAKSTDIKAARRQQDTVRELYETDGLSVRKIAIKLGLSPTRIHQIAVDAGVKRRHVGSGK